MEKSEHYSSQNNLYDAIDDSRAVMNDKDKHLYNLLHRSTVKKVHIVNPGSNAIPLFIMGSVVIYITYTYIFFAANILQPESTTSRENSSTSENWSMS